MGKGLTKLLFGKAVDWDLLGCQYELVGGQAEDPGDMGTFSDIFLEEISVHHIFLSKGEEKGWM